MTRLSPALAALTLPLTLTAAPAMADRVSVLVFDASGSMWNRVEGDLTRIEVARDVMGDYFASRDQGQPLSVIAYGHNRRGDCGDIQVIAPMGQTPPGDLEARLRALMPRGMTPLTDSLALARDQIPPTAEAADIILVTDGLETCEGDPCALAASLAAEGIDIRAHVVGFGLTRAEVDALACITDQTGGMLFDTNSGAELARALQQVSAAPPPPDPAPEPAPEAAFDIGDKAEAGFTYTISWRGEAAMTDYLGFVPQGEDRAPSSGSFNTINIQPDGTPRNPLDRTAPAEPGMYDLIIRTAAHGVIARQPVEVVAPAMGFDPIGSVEPGSRLRVTFRAPEQLGERVVIADPDQPVNEHQRHDWNNALHSRGAMGLTAPQVPGEYELRYLNSGATGVMFSRRFGVGVPFVDADLTRSDDLAAQATAATQGAAAQDQIAAVTATFRLPEGVPDSAVTWDAVPLDPDMAPEAWAPMDTGPTITGTFEPGRWRVTARAPGETEFSADLDIFPGQDNDFTLPLTSASHEDHGSVLPLEGDWQILAIPPYDAPAGAAEGPIRMMRITLTQGADGFTGRFTLSGSMGGPVGGPQVAGGDLDRAEDEDGNLFLQFTQTQLSPEPFRIALGPLGDHGWSGTMTSGANSVPVVFWPDSQPLPDLTTMQTALYGAAPQGRPTDVPIVARCDEAAGCRVTQGRLTALLPQGWGMTEPLFFSAVGDNLPTDLPMMSFHGPMPGEELRLNPHQWLASNGPCISTGAGPLCWFFDAAPGTAVAAQTLAPSLVISEGQAGPGDPAPSDLAADQPCAQSACRFELPQAGLVAELPQGWWVRQAGREDGTPRAQFTNGGDLIMLVGRDGWNPENGPCLDSAAGPVCFWGGTGNEVRIAAAFIASTLTPLPDGPDTSPEGPVTLAPAGGGILAGSGGSFPITFEAPDGFQGQVTLHAPGGAEVFQADAGWLLGAQDQVLPVPATPGLYEARVHDASGRLRATTGIQVRIDDRPEAIRIGLRARTQFGSGCMMGADLSMPDGGRFTFSAPLEAVRDDDGTPVPGLLNPDAPVTLEITGFGGSGATLAPLAFAAPCEAMILRVGPARCTMGEGAAGEGAAGEGAAGDCPLPVTYAAPQGLLGLRLTGSDQLEMDQGAATGPAPQPAPALLPDGGVVPDEMTFTLDELAPPQPLPAEAELPLGRELTAEEIDDLIWDLTGKPQE
ncbi:MAG: vWA domain-containing protein [Paracoccus sp. (in: a-proteobacteria)]|uniref:vWA domain-containing protein n=1 Tax=Paracoccus sp. TaxID=267 RepID=UPI00391A471C